MTAPQRMIVRRGALKGSLVQLEDDRRDKYQARTWLVLKGDNAGNLYWLRDDQLEPEPPYADPGISTKDEW